MNTVNHPGEVAFVTGANRDVGLKTARQPARVAVLAIIGTRSEPSGKAAVEQLCDEGPEGGPNGGFFHLGEALPW
jgi:NAD(P)-dependent dehydrogenase (short-subunit alcohol dehydrogenase family)